MMVSGLQEDFSSPKKGKLFEVIALDSRKQRQLAQKGRRMF